MDESAIRRFVATHPRLVDALFAGALTVFLFGVRLAEPLPGNPGRAAVVLGALLAQCVPMLWHRTRPWLVVGVVSVGFVMTELVDPVSGLDNSTPLVVANYVVGRRAATPRSALVIAVIPAVTVLPATHKDLDWLSILTILAISAAVWLLGVSHQRIAADTARLRDLAERLRAEQERSARRAVAVERARIAHDLHDLVAHHISAIAMQARATADVVTEDPARAGAGLAGIGTAADTALIEMRRLLRLLATDDSADLRPEPSLHYLTRLTDELAGFDTTVTIAPEAEKAPAAAQAAAYWVVREALTNVLRHAGPTTIDIEVGLHNATLTVTVSNGPPSETHTPMTGSGLGLIGMRERVRLFAGTLNTGPHANGWRVSATFELADPS